MSILLDCSLLQGLAVTRHQSAQFVRNELMNTFANGCDEGRFFEAAPIRFCFRPEKVCFHNEAEASRFNRATVQVLTRPVQSVPRRFSNHPMVDPPCNTLETHRPLLLQRVKSVNCNCSVVIHVNLLG